MRKLVAIALTAVLVATACGDSESDRPSLMEWTPAWQELQDLVPDAAVIESEDGDGTTVCSDFLGEVRTRRPDVIPTPDGSLEEPVTEWVSEAESIGLDCEREGDLEERLDDLRELGAEIDARVDLLES